MLIVIAMNEFNPVEIDKQVGVISQHVIFQLDEVALVLFDADHFVGIVAVFIM